MAVLATVGPWAGALALHALGGDLAGVALLAVTVALGPPHVLATVAMYADPELGEHLRGNWVRYAVVPGLVLAGALLLAAFGPLVVIQVALAGVGIWTSHHFACQNIGMVAFACRSLGVAGPDTVERRAIKLTGVAAVLAAVPYMRGAGLDLPFDRAFWLAGLAVFTMASVTAFRGKVDQPLERTLAMAAAMLFFAPLFVPQIPFTLAVAAYGSAHGAQYMLMVGHLGAGRSRRDARRHWLILTVSVVAGGALLVHANRTDPTGDLRLLLAVAQAVTVAHFIADAGLWKMRDPDHRAYMRRHFQFL